MICSSAVSNSWKFEFAIFWDLQQELSAPDKYSQTQLSAGVRRRLANYDHLLLVVDFKIKLWFGLLLDPNRAAAAVKTVLFFLNF